MGRGMRLAPDSIAFEQGFPSAVDQLLNRPEVGFVGHFGTLSDPVTKVEKRQLQQVTLFNLPKDIEGTVAGAGYGGVEKRVHRRQAVVQDVDNRDHTQLAIWFPEFDQASVDFALQKELRILVSAVLVHAAAWMTA